MTCIAGERFIEMLEGAGLDDVTREESGHLRSCRGCQEGWSRLVGADELMRVLPAPVPSQHRSWGPLIAAAAAILLIVGIALWRPPGNAGAPSPAAGRQDGEYKVEPVVSSVSEPAELPLPKAAPAIAGPLVALHCSIIRSADDLLDRPESVIRAVRRSRSAMDDKVRRLEGQGRAKLLSSPRLTVVNAQRGSMQVVDQFAYIQEYEIICSEEAASADPVIGILQVGLSLDVLPVIVDAAAGDIRIEELNVAVADHDKSVRTYSTPHGKIESPGCLKLTYQARSVLLGRGEALVLGPMKGPRDADEPLWAVLSGEILKPQESEKK